MCLTGRTLKFVAMCSVLIALHVFLLLYFLSNKSKNWSQKRLTKTQINLISPGSLSTPQICPTLAWEAPRSDPKPKKYRFWSGAFLVGLLGCCVVKSVASLFHISDAFCIYPNAAQTHKPNQPTHQPNQHPKSSNKQLENDFNMSSKWSPAELKMRSPARPKMDPQGSPAELKMMPRATQNGAPGAQNASQNRLLKWGWIA